MGFAWINIWINAVRPSRSQALCKVVDIQGVYIHKKWYGKKHRLSRGEADSLSDSVLTELDPAPIKLDLAPMELDLTPTDLDPAPTERDPACTELQTTGWRYNWNKSTSKDKEKTGI